MSDRDVVLLCAGAVFTVMVIPVSRRVRTALLLLVVGFAAYRTYSSGLLSAVGPIG